MTKQFFIELPEEFAQANDGYQKGCCVFKPIKTKNSKWVTGVQDMNVFPEIFENTQFPIISLSFDDFDHPDIGIDFPIDPATEWLYPERPYKMYISFAQIARLVEPQNYPEMVMLIKQNNTPFIKKDDGYDVYFEELPEQNKQIMLSFGAKFYYK